MVIRNEDLHGSVPDQCDVALLLIDVINDMDFPESDQLIKHALPAAHCIQALQARARQLGIPSIYVNDNFGKWRSDFSALLKHCLDDDVVGRPVAQLLKPHENDYFVLKPKHSAFFSTTLDTLLRYLHAKTLIVTGFAGNICVLFTANEAYMRDFSLIVPSDCVASNTVEENSHALQQMKKVLKADITPSTGIELEPLLTRHKIHS
jgi:nicotinamidase-related amidase